MTYTWDRSKSEGAAAGTGNRIVPGSIKPNGVPISLSAMYRVTVNSFIASDGDRLTVFASGTNRQLGAVDLDATIAYFKSVGTIAVPALNRISAIN